MPATDIRQRTALLFIAVIVGHILLISAQVNSQSGVPVLESVTFGAFSELQRGAASVTGGLRGGWSGYVGLRGVREETGLPVSSAEDPLSSVVLGAGKMLGEFDLLRKIAID